MTRVSGKRVPPTYAQHERRSHAARTTKTGYFKAKSRKRHHMRRRAPVRDSARPYRCGVIKVAPLSKYKTFSKGARYSGPFISRVGKTVAESRHEDEALRDMADLVDLTNEEEGSEPRGAARCHGPDPPTSCARSPVLDVIVLDGTSDDDKQEVELSASTFGTNTRNELTNSVGVGHVDQGGAPLLLPEVICLVSSSDSETCAGELFGAEERRLSNTALVEDTAAVAEEAARSPIGPEVICIDISSNDSDNIPNEHDDSLVDKMEDADRQSSLDVQVGAVVGKKIADEDEVQDHFDANDAYDGDMESEPEENSSSPLSTESNPDTVIPRLYTEADAVPWPGQVEEITHTQNPRKIGVPDLGSMDWCGCEFICRPDTCPNAVTSIFCARNNCLNGKYCGNRLRTLNGLRLASGDVGYSVFTTEKIFEGAIVAEYAGVLTTHDYSKDKKQISDYTIGLETRSTRRHKLWIEARDKGNIARFMNHSCAANCKFYEVQNRRFVTVAVVAMEDIGAGCEVTLDYGDELWFKCLCDSEDCRGGSDEEFSEDGSGTVASGMTSD